MLNSFELLGYISADLSNRILSDSAEDNPYKGSFRSPCNKKKEWNIFIKQLGSQAASSCMKLSYIILKIGVFKVP